MIWQDRERTDATKRKFTDENGVEQTVHIEEIQSNITQSGTPVNATTMNNIEKNLGTYGNDTYDSTATYQEGNVVTHNALLYRAKQDIETPEEWTEAHWEETSALAELSNTSGNEVVIGDEEDVTRQTKILVDTTDEFEIINQEVCIGATNPNNIKTWFKQGKNLFGNYTIVNGYISTPAFMRIRDTLADRLAFIPCEPNTTYTISRNITTTRFRVGEYTDIPNMTNSNQDFNLPQNIIDNNSGTDMTYTTTATAKYLIIMYANTTEDSNIGQALDGIQVEKGNTATTFEGYIIPEIHTDKKKIYQEEIKTRLFFSYNGTHERFTLNDDAKHYKEIEITFGHSSWSNMKQKLKVVPQQSGTTPCGLFAMYPSSTGSAIVVGGALMEIGSGGTNVEFPRMLAGSITTTGYQAESNVYLNVYEVVGYK